MMIKGTLPRLDRFLTTVIPLLEMLLYFILKVLSFFKLLKFLS